MVAHSAIIVSPHIDDAIFSLGLTVEQLLLKKQRVKIINCFSRSNFTIDRRSSSIKTVTALRKKEDRILNKILDNKIIFDYLDLPEYPIRTIDYDPKLVETLVLKLKTLISNSNHVYAPLAIGDHIDHQICLEAILVLRRSIKIDLTFFEDLPYSQIVPREMITSKVKWIENEIQQPLLPKLNKFTSSGKKKRLINAYASQLNEAVTAGIHDYALKIKGERIWKVRPRS